MKSTSSLPVNEKTFTINVKGETTGKMWNGKFVTVCMPTLRQKSDAAVMEARLGGDLQSIDASTRMYHRMIAQLAFRLIEAPDWWLAADSGQDLLDLNVIFEVFQKCAEAEKEWREEIWGPEKEEGIKSSDSEDKSEEPSK